MPKVKGLLRILADHEGALTADFQRVYGLRLADAVLTRTLPEIEDLIVWLPAESSFRAQFLAKGKMDVAQREWSWSQEKELLLALVNLITHQTYIISQANSAKRIQPPQLIDSPRGQAPAKRGDADTQARALIAAARARKKGQ